MRAVRAGALVALFAAPALAQPPARDAAPATGTAAIRGRIVAAAGERPLAKVEVRAVAGENRVNKAVLSDANGRYEIDGLPAGRFIVSASKQNYVRMSYGERRPLGPGAPIDVAAGQTVSRIDFVLQRTAAIAGRIVDEFGDPAPNVQVQPLRYVYSNGERRMQAAGPPATTNDLGEYRVFGLAPGLYFLGATLRPMNYFSDASDRIAYLPTLYPGTGNPSEAQRLTVAPGQTISGINLTLLPVSASRVSGAVAFADGKAMSSGTVNATSRAMATGSAGFGQLRPDGTFTISGLPPGDYTLRANDFRSQEEYAVAEVTVSGGDLTNVQLIMLRASTIRGRVVFDDRSAKRPAPAAARLSAMSLTPSHSPPPMAAGAAPNDDWTFELKAAAGPTTVRAGIADWRIDRVLTADGADITDSGVDVLADATVEGITVVMTTRHNEVSGTVVDESGAKQRDCFVVAFARDPLRWTPATRFLSIARPDLEGIYRLRVPAGDYFIAAFGQTDPAGMSFYDPDILQQLREQATAFSIGATEIKQLDLRLGPPPVY
ncbi:MAG TPA: carboxypeptidase-like regulatory domain-containing protein [Vicinamibacterales bacterium]|nr:carboxypeptidase-like regulatory domain-containing protein [Vicinamibacterales bacterium]